MRNILWSLSRTDISSTHSCVFVHYTHTHTHTHHLSREKNKTRLLILPFNFWVVSHFKHSHGKRFFAGNMIKYQFFAAVHLSAHPLSIPAVAWFFFFFSKHKLFSYFLQSSNGWDWIFSVLFFFRVKLKYLSLVSVLLDSHSCFWFLVVKKNKKNSLLRIHLIPIHPLPKQLKLEKKNN